MCTENLGYATYLTSRASLLLNPPETESNAYSFSFQSIVELIKLRGVGANTFSTFVRRQFCFNHQARDSDISGHVINKT